MKISIGLCEEVTPRFHGGGNQLRLQLFRETAPVVIKAAGFRCSGKGICPIFATPSILTASGGM
jgi:hypothetical protein